MTRTAAAGVDGRQSVNLPCTRLLFGDGAPRARRAVLVLRAERNRKVQGLLVDRVRSALLASGPKRRVCDQVPVILLGAEALRRTRASRRIACLIMLSRLSGYLLSITRVY
jgi:hypothetical protein